MRKNIILSALLFFTISFVAWADSSAIDGRMQVAAEGELPSGLFVKAAGYLPGDTISLTNPTTGQSIELLNLGTLDPNGPVAMMLSPESAEKLGINARDDMQVKLAGRSESFDSLVTGSGVLSSVEKKNTNPSSKNYSDDYDEDGYGYEDDGGDFLADKRSIEQPSLLDDQPYGFERETSETSQVEKAPETAPVAYEKFDADDIPEHTGFADSVNEEVASAEPEVSPKPSYVPEEKTSPIERVNDDDLLAFSPVRDQTPLEETKKEPKPDSPSLYELVNDVEPPVSLPDEDDEPVADFSAEDERSWTSEPEIDENRLAEKDSSGEQVVNAEPVEKPLEEKVTVEEPLPVEDSVDENRSVSKDYSGEEVASVEPREKIAAEKILEEKDSVQEPEDSLDEDRALASDEAGEEVASVEPVKKEEPLIASDKAGEEVVSFEPDMRELSLEPSVDEDRTASRDADGEDVLSQEPVIAPEVTDEPSVVEVTEPEEYEAIVLVPADEKAPDANEIVFVPEEKEEKKVLSSSEKISSVCVESEDELKGGYYVQIATIDSEEAVENLLDTYHKYPLVLVKIKSGAYRVMIGSLSEDEYGAVLAKFKAFGFNDAFLRKLKGNGGKLKVEK